MSKFSKKNIKLGILGGTFDPPHIGHLYISKIAIKNLRLNKLIWVVAKKNPLKKKPYLKFNTRIKLSKKMICKERKIHVGFFDKKINSINTFDLLNYIKNRQKKAKLYFLMGADNLIKLHKWKNWELIPKLAKIVIFPRKNYLNKKSNYIALKSLKKKDLIYIKSKKINISSSLIRKFW